MVTAGNYDYNGDFFDNYMGGWFWLKDYVNNDDQSNMCQEWRSDRRPDSIQNWDWYSLFFAVSSSVSTFQCTEHCIIYGIYTVYINMFSNKGLFVVID